MERYTNDGQHFFYEGDHIENHYCLNKAWYISHGYLPYKAVAEDGEDGPKDGWWVHYMGAPRPAPEPEPVPEPTEEEKAAQAEAERKARIEMEIMQLKAELSASDYKVIKNEEYYMAHREEEDVTLPYDPVQLYNERQALRDRINQLEAELTPETETEETETQED